MRGRVITLSRKICLLNSWDSARYLSECTRRLSRLGWHVEIYGNEESEAGPHFTIIPSIGP